MSRVDSSDEEAEELALASRGIEDKDRYLTYLTRNVRESYNAKRASMSPADAMSLSFGLAMHNYSDRIFNNGDLREQYLQKKAELLGHAPEVRRQFLDEARGVLVENPGMFVIPKANITKLPDKDVEKLFNAAFNRKVALPDGLLIDDAESANLKEIFSEAAKAGKMDLGFLHKKQMLELSLPESPSMWPVNAEIARRSARDLSKASQMIGIDGHQITSMPAPDSLRSPIMPVNARSSGNISTDQMVGAASYSKEEEFMQENAGHMRNFIRKGTFDPALDMQTRAKIMEMSSLMFVLEVERSKATLLTSPMMLDKLIIDPATQMSEYPMAPEGAVGAARKIRDLHADSLFNARALDSTPLATKADAEKMLVSEGRLLSNWAALRGDSNLSDIGRDLEAVSQMGRILEKGPNLSPTEYKELVSGIKLACAHHPALNDADRGIIDKAYRNAQSISDKLRGKVSDIDQLDSDCKHLQKLCAEKKLPESLEKKALEKLDTAVASSIQSLDDKILTGYYKINPAKIFTKQQGKQAEMDIPISEKIRALEKRAEIDSSDLDPDAIVAAFVEKVSKENAQAGSSYKMPPSQSKARSKSATKPMDVSKSVFQ